MQRCWLDRQRTNGIIWAVIRSGFVDWQKLNKRETDFRNPINKLPQRAEIADAKIVLPAQRKKRHEHSSNLLFRREFHQENVECRMSNAERMTKSEQQIVILGEV